VARPFPKFFNYGEQPDEDTRRLGQPFTLSEKVDGSLGIHYRWNGTDGIATRGSFHSPQAQWATAALADSPPVRFDYGRTHLFEIVYPENRIVVDYGDRAELVYLATLDWRTGETVGGWAWPLSRRATQYQVPAGTDLGYGAMWLHRHPDGAWTVAHVSHEYGAEEVPLRELLEMRDAIEDGL
jgi:RNA ligase